MTGPSSLDINVGDSILTIVPAVHYQVAFAEAVNEIVCNASSRPDAIAVELGPSITLAITNWLSELGVGPGQRFPLPCLLGLMARQRFLSPSVREKALKLQHEYGLELNELPSEVLDIELDFKSTLLAPISPTCSLTEALRCALEVKVPVYGVDLEEHASAKYDDIIFPDASTSKGRLADYINENIQFVDSLNCNSVDERRELAMAARLKELLQRNKRVLFTCGLSHWRRVARLVCDPAVQATSNLSTLAESELTDRYKRMVIHPSLAFQYLDRLPAVARHYERRRLHPRLGNPNQSSKPIAILELYKFTLRRAIRNYIRKRDIPGSDLVIANGRLNRLIDFPRIVFAHSLLGLNEVPSVTETLRCAKTFVSDSFASALAKHFFKLRWAQSTDYDDCQTLVASEQVNNSNNKLRIRRGRVLAEPTHVNGAGEIEWIGLSDEQLVSKSDYDAESTGEAEGYSFTWTPWEELVTGLCDEAITLLLRNQLPCLAEPFRDSVKGGIALKATVLARARGDHGLYVYSDSLAEAYHSVDVSEGWPVVWIFDTEERHKSSWNNYVIPTSWLLPFLDSTDEHKLQGALSNRNLLAILCYGDDNQNYSADALDCGVHASKLRGFIAYAPIFKHDQQYAHWIKQTKGLHNPLFSRSNLSDIPDTLSNHCKSQGIPLGKLRWQEDIVRMAIPFAGRQVTVVLPKHFKLAPEVYQEAARLGKHLSIINLDHFLATDIERAQSHLTVPGMANSVSPIYAKNAETAIAENRNRFTHRMPEKWKRYGF